MPTLSGTWLQGPGPTTIAVPFGSRRTGVGRELKIEALRKRKRPWSTEIGLVLSVRFSPSVALKSKAVVARTPGVVGDGLEGPARSTKIPAREADTTTTATITTVRVGRRCVGGFM